MSEIHLVGPECSSSLSLEDMTDRHSEAGMASRRAQVSQVLLMKGGYGTVRKSNDKRSVGQHRVSYSLTLPNARPLPRRLIISFIREGQVGPLFNASHCPSSPSSTRGAEANVQRRGKPCKPLRHGPCLGEAFIAVEMQSTEPSDAHYLGCRAARDGIPEKDKRIPEEVRDHGVKRSLFHV